MSPNATTSPEQPIVVGAGPYGLAVTAYLRAAGLDPHVIGDPMVFWRRNMPRGMLLRSAWEASHIADPHRQLTLDRYAAERGEAIPEPIPLDDFIAYGDWVQGQVAPNVDRREVVEIDREDGRLLVRFDNGQAMAAERVIVATGLRDFPRRPPLFSDLDPSLVSHSADHDDLAGFAGRRVLVVGGGQSALESAALLREASAEVEVLVRAGVIHWLPNGRVAPRLGPARRILYPPTDVGPPGLNWIVAVPEAFRSLPYRLQGPTARRCIRPAGAHWLRSRLAGVPLETSRAITSATATGDGVEVGLDGGERRRVDHVLLATGYGIDVDKYTVLAPALRRAVRRRLGAPLLTAGFESSIAGLHFVGAAGAESFGPIMRFVAGTGFTGREVARAIAGAGIPRRRPPWRARGVAGAIGGCRTPAR